MERRWQGHADRPLTERGREQARALAERLADVNLEAVYARPASGMGDGGGGGGSARGRVVQVPELREVDVGSWSASRATSAPNASLDAFTRWQEGGSGWEDGELHEEMGECIGHGPAARRRAPGRRDPRRLARRACPRGARPCPRRGHRYSPPHRLPADERPSLRCLRGERAHCPHRGDVGTRRGRRGEPHRLPQRLSTPTTSNCLFTPRTPTRSAAIAITS